MNYLVLDLEMTGGDPTWHEVIQIGACLFDYKWELKGKYLQNVYPENEESFSMPAYEVHGLSLEELNNAPMMYDVLPAFEDWIVQTLAGHKNVQTWQRAGYLKKVAICGQSILGDVNFLQFAYRNEKMPWPFSYKLIDLHNLSFFLFKILRANGVQTPKSLSLDAVADYFGHKRSSDIHNAQEDALITGYCLRDAMAYDQKLKLVEQ